jgi:hypothetical protein
MTRARMASGTSATRVSPHARPRQRPLGRELEPPKTPPKTRPIRTNERALLPGSTSKRDGSRFGRSAGHSADRRVYARVGIVLGTAAFVFFMFVAVGSWLVPAPTNGAREDAPSAKTAQEPSRSSTAARIPSPQRPDPGRGATAAPAWTNPPEQKHAVAVVIPRTPFHERLPDSQHEQLPESSPPIETAPPWATSAEPTTTTPQLDLNQTEDAKRVQQRLIERGFLSGTADGVWGARSRKALQDFRIANGMGDGDTWDEATQERLLAASDASAANVSDMRFIGGWGVDAAQCREAPVKITARRAVVSGAACDFRSTQRDGLNAWRMRARCAGNGERWTANIRFTLSGSKLVWSSERGTTSYVRCPS